ncbi:2OG-Fe(II) oxygenase-like protein [Staphylotrichum tortipilum]|uniref:2OG-Fe(II) oxygenase-like protein n=1 Tax=Staphylotrichum tortipilum TaxID=2831512 RepID=A0AAN6MLK7_9PEZI|nr:2OG-Fe(II) oxygenase-like protein [Staphylotrichum longicolle]
MGIPLLDVAQTHAGPEARKSFLRDLIQSFQDYGFVRLTNHSVPAARVKQMFDLAGDVFRLDAETKLAFTNVADGSPQRGYSAIGVEKTASLHGKLVGRNVDERLTDAREHFDCGSPLNEEFKNRWPKPDSLGGFQDELEAFYFEMEQATAELLGWLEEGMGAPQGTFNNLITHQGNASELRLNHYPPVPASLLRGGHVSRIWPHFDLGVITLLFTSGVGGLEVEDRKAAGPQTFIPVEPESGAELIVNISETLQRWTDDKLPAGLHRVSIPKALEEKIQSDTDAEVPRRYSIAYLAKADRQVSVGTIPAFQLGEKPRYESVTAAEYHRLRLLAAY